MFIFPGKNLSQFDKVSSNEFPKSFKLEESNPHSYLERQGSNFSNNKKSNWSISKTRTGDKNFQNWKIELSKPLEYSNFEKRISKLDGLDQILKK